MRRRRRQPSRKQRAAAAAPAESAGELINGRTRGVAKVTPPSLSRVPSPRCRWTWSGRRNGGVEVPPRGDSLFSFFFFFFFFFFFCLLLLLLLLLLLFLLHLLLSWVSCVSSSSIRRTPCAAGLRSRPPARDLIVLRLMTSNPSTRALSPICFFFLSSTPFYRVFFFGIPLRWTGFARPSLALTDFYRVLLGFRGLYWA